MRSARARGGSGARPASVVGSAGGGGNGGGGGASPGGESSRCDAIDRRRLVQQAVCSYSSRLVECVVLALRRALSHSPNSRAPLCRSRCSVVCCWRLALTANLLPAPELLFVAWRCRWSILARSSMTSTARQRSHVVSSFHNFAADQTNCCCAVRPYARRRAGGSEDDRRPPSRDALLNTVLVPLRDS